MTNEFETSNQSNEGRSDRPWWKKKRFVIPLGLLILGIFLPDSSTETSSQTSSAEVAPSASPSPTKADPMADAQSIVEAASVGCPKFVKTLKSLNSTWVANNKLAEPASSDPYKAQKSRNKNTWMVEGKASAEFAQLAKTTLLPYVGEKTFSDAQFMQLGAMLAAKCGVSDMWDEAKSSAELLDGNVQRVIAAAGNVPWYPEGYSLWGADENVAWRWLKSSEYRCSYSSGSCWGVSVITELGCPSSLYAELSISDRAGNAIDYTNAVLRGLQPGQKGKLIFDTFNDSAKTGRLIKINCY